jgi:lysophospholipase L1-like esterase
MRDVYEGEGVASAKQSELLPDGVHPNAEGYVRWREALSQIIKR